MGFSSSGGSGSSSSSAVKTTQYGDTTTTNPYVVSRTTNKGTTTTLQPNTSMSSIYDFTNANIDNLLNQYLNPSTDTATNKAKMNYFTRNLEDSTRQNLENNIIAPLAQRNMIRSSQATDLYNNLAKQNSRAIADYADNLMASSQNDTGNIINNLMNYVLQGWNVINGNQAQSLNTSQGNAVNTSTGNTSSKSNSWGFSS